MTLIKQAYCLWIIDKKFRRKKKRLKNIYYNNENYVYWTIILKQRKYREFHWMDPFFSDFVFVSTLILLKYVSMVLKIPTFECKCFR